MNKYKLASHPTPNQDTFDFDFSSEKEQLAYITFEYAHTRNYHAALGAALSKKERDVAKEKLTVARKRVYKIWSERDKPLVGRLA